MTEAEALALLALVARMRTAQKARTSWQVFYSPHDAQTVRAIEKAVDEALAKLGLTQKGEGAT